MASGFSIKWLSGLAPVAAMTLIWFPPPEGKTLRGNLIEPNYASLLSFSCDHCGDGILPPDPFRRCKFQKTHSRSNTGRPLPDRACLFQQPSTIEGFFNLHKAFRTPCLDGSLRQGILETNSSWQELPGDVTAQGSATSSSDPAPNAAGRFYRIVEVP